jgi:carboxypeptidase D
VKNPAARAVIEKRSPNTEFKDHRLRKRAHNFLTNSTVKFEVNGTGIPDVPFDIGESYAGLLPISGDPDETRELFFWFFPTTNADPKEEIAIWFNGGPGCSSLSGLLTENGPFTWEAGTLAPVQNPYTWVNLTNMMWVEQPVGVGFTQVSISFLHAKSGLELIECFTGNAKYHK